MKIKAVRQITVATLDRVPPGEGRKACLRALRAPLLAAFDIYKSNVYYGIVKENDADRAAVLAWYQALLDLDERAVKSPPTAVAKYGEGAGV